MTLLVTKKMSPELAARVRASVAGRGESGGRLPPRATALLRAGVLAVIVATVAWLSLTFRRARQELEEQRSTLLSRVDEESKGVDVGSVLPRVRPWLALFSERWAGDLVADELRAPGALDKRLAASTLYVRGPVSGFSGAELERSAAASFKDPFVRCLNAPPKERTEKALRRKVRARGKLDHVQRLHDAMVGLPFLGRPFRERVLGASAPDQLARLSRQLDRAPLAAAKQAARSELLLLAMDEPGDRSKPAELDGERPHQVRVGLIDMANERVLLRLRRPVDPSWVSPATRAEFANGIDSCALALDVRKAVASPVASAAR